MSEISLFELEVIEDELASMPSETATDGDIPDQTPEPDLGDE